MELLYPSPKGQECCYQGHKPAQQGWLLRCITRTSKTPWLLMDNKEGKVIGYSPSLQNDIFSIQHPKHLVFFFFFFFPVPSLALYLCVIQSLSDILMDAILVEHNLLWKHTDSQTLWEQDGQRWFSWKISRLKKSKQKKPRKNPYPMK